MATESRQMQQQFAMWFNLTPWRRRLQQFVLRYPAPGLALAGLAALPGLLFLVGLPLAALVLVWRLPAMVLTAADVGAWLQIGLEAGLIILGIVVMWGLLRMPGPPPAGLPLEPAMAPALFDLVGELESEYGRPAVDRIVLRPEFVLRIVPDPRPGWPGRSNHTLVIGLPLLLTLPPEHFKALLARRIGQHSLRHNLLSGLLARWRDVFRSYQRSTAQSKALPHRLFNLFFRFYHPLYRRLSVYAAQLDELEADRYGLEVINDRDMVTAISQEIVTRAFMEKKFWPKIRQLQRRGSETGQLPFRHMTAVVRKGLTADDARHSLQEAMAQDVARPATRPPLRYRLENMGHDHPATPPMLAEPAAQAYLAPTTQQRLIQHFDGIWRKRGQREDRRIT